jgi:vacuolar-type H+-ATPase subunit H
MHSQKLLFCSHYFMTVLDEVLQAENHAATKLAEAEVAALTQAADAKKAQGEAVAAEKKRLAQAEATALAEHEKTVHTKSQAITVAAEKDVTAIKAAFEANAATLQGKISAAIA